MRPLSKQHTWMQGFTAAFTVLRLLTPLKMSYEAAKKRAEPYTKIVEELPQMRRETVHLVRQAVSESHHAYVLVNNRSEGNAPLTVEALADAVRPPYGRGTKRERHRSLAGRRIVGGGRTTAQGISGANGRIFQGSQCR
jgi:hypothetical protein